MSCTGPSSSSFLPAWLQQAALMHAAPAAVQPEGSAAAQQPAAAPAQAASSGPEPQPQPAAPEAAAPPILPAVSEAPVRTRDNQTAELQQQTEPSARPEPPDEQLRQVPGEAASTTLPQILRAEQLVHEKPPAEAVLAAPSGVHTGFIPVSREGKAEAADLAPELNPEPQRAVASEPVLPPPDVAQPPEADAAQVSVAITVMKLQQHSSSL